MIVGNGRIARSLALYRDRTEVLMFAAGVSDSQAREPSEFAREARLVRESIAASPGKTFVYFSTCSIADAEMRDTPYVRHKLEMEQTIKAESDSFLIVRLPQVVGAGGNENGLVNFLVRQIRAGTRFVLWERATRYVIDVDDVSKIVTRLDASGRYRNRVVNVASRRYRILEIVRALEVVLQTRALYTTAPRGSSYDVDCSDVAPVLKDLGLAFDGEYLPRVLRKYYAHQRAIV